MNGIRIADSATGRFSICAMHPFASDPVLRLPYAAIPREQSIREQAVNDLCSRINLRIQSSTGLQFVPRFPSERLPESPNARWLVLEAEMPGGELWELIEQLRRREKIPPEVTVESAKPSLLIYEGGILLFVIKTTFTTRSTSGEVPQEFPRIVLTTVDAMFSVDRDIPDYSLGILRNVSGQLGGSMEELRRCFGRYVVRERESRIDEEYPTVLTAIECRAGVRLRALDLEATDLPEAMNFDRSELRNILPSFEPDYLAVCYDSAWLLHEELQSRDDIERRIARFEELFEYCLVLWMQAYALNSEVNAELRSIRELSISGARYAVFEDKLKLIRELRGEVEEILRQLSPQAFSTWVPNIFVFRAILRAWFVDDSTKSLGVSLETIHRELIEIEQRNFTALASVFAVAGVLGVFVASITLLFTQTHWEQDLKLGIGALIAKGAFVVCLIGLPWLVVNKIVLRKWPMSIGRLLNWIRMGKRGGQHAGD